MDKFKLKNFILAMLVLVNIFLLFIVVSGQVKTERLKRRREETLYSILLANGISPGENLDLDARPLPEVSLMRSLEAENDAVSSLLGKCETQDLGGNIISFVSDRGEARFRGTGEFELTFQPGVIPQGDDPAVTASDAVKRLGFHSVPEQAQVTGGGNDLTVVLTLTYKGMPVFNSRIACLFSEGSLSLMEGRAFFNKVKSKNSTEDMPDACTILVRFLDYISVSGLDCGSVDTIEAGYFAESTVVGECAMRPVWRIGADIGEFFFDGVTGSPVQLDARE